MKYKNKLKLKLFLYDLLGLLTLFIILIIAWLNNRLFETFMSMICFYIYRPMFTKQFHSKSLFTCSLISIAVFAFVSHIEMDVAVSLLSPSIISLLLTYISYFVRDYLDNVILLKSYKAKLDKLNVKSIDKLTEDELIDSLPKIRYEVIHIVYEYLHKPIGQKSANFAMRHNVSEATLYRYLKLVKDSYENLIK